MKRFLLALSLTAALSVVPGCGGGGPGSPGSQGSEDTGVMVSGVVNFTENKNADIQSSNVDAFQEVCQPGPPPTLEPFRDHTAPVDFTATLINTSTTFQAGTLFIDKYTVDFKSKNDSIGAPPIQSFVGFQTVTIPAPAPGSTTPTTATATFMMVDLARKIQYANDMTSGRFGSTTPGTLLNNYSATFTFEGHNQFGKAFSFKTQVDFSIGDFANCSQ